MKIKPIFALLSCSLTAMNIYADETEHDPAEIAIGERLTLETRFAQAFYANNSKADSVMDKTITSSGDLRGPFAGKTMNCRACHLVDEHTDNPKAGVRSYADFAARPTVPARRDDAKTSLRNSMSMVNISIQRHHGTVFHFDGQFNSIEDLVRGTFTGRNFGWLPEERDVAIRHLAKIIREDDGNGELAQEFGGSYRKVLKGTDKSLPNELRLPQEYRIDVDKATDQQILDTMAKLVGAYVNNLTFAMDEKGNYNGSPYDIFLQKNNLPRQPRQGESPRDYSKRLLNEINNLEKPVFVSNKDNKFKSHAQDFVFSEKELHGMKLFFRQSNHKQRGGNCVSCHTAPNFSDFGFHNTGLSQLNYERLHGSGSFNKLDIPDLGKRNANYDKYLPATAKHPHASSRFSRIENRTKPDHVDLGLWNVFANPDMPASQAKLKKIVFEQAIEKDIKNCSIQSLLPLTVAAFKTPVLRDLGHSAPYMHTGQFNGLNETLEFYINASAMARAGQLRTPAPALKHINLTTPDIELLVAFLQALNEDYE